MDVISNSPIREMRFRKMKIGAGILTQSRYTLGPIASLYRDNLKPEEDCALATPEAVESGQLILDSAAHINCPPSCLTARELLCSS